MASIEVRGKSVRAIVRVDGKKRSATFDTRAQALTWIKQMEGTKASSTVTVGALFEEYLDEVAGKTDSAKFNKLRILNWLRDPICERTLGEIVTYDINQWIARRLEEVGPATVNRELNLMSGAFRYALRARKWIEVNPCHGAQRPRQPQARDRPLLTPSQLAAIRISAGEDLTCQTARVGACFFLALETGMRSGEILRLKPADYLPHLNTLVVAGREQGGRKTGARRVPLTAEAKRLLDALLPLAGEYIVGVSDANRDALWRKIVRRAGLDDAHFHDAKHEACTRLSRFLDVLELSHAIGTKDIRLLRDTYYVSDASRAAARLPASLVSANA
jgi:integrase